MNSVEDLIFNIIELNKKLHLVGEERKTKLFQRPEPMLAFFTYYISSTYYTRNNIVAFEICRTPHFRGKGVSYSWNRTPDWGEVGLDTATGRYFYWFGWEYAERNGRDTYVKTKRIFSSRFEVLSEKILDHVIHDTFGTGR